MGRRLKGGNNGNGSDTGPLKKIIGICFVGGVRMECYECGHIRLQKSDIIGKTNAERRRCSRCKAGKPVQFVGDPPESMTNEEYDRRVQHGVPVIKKKFTVFVDVLRASGTRTYEVEAGTADEAREMVERGDCRFVEEQLETEELSLPEEWEVRESEQP